MLRWVNNPGASMNATLFKAPGQPRYSTIFMYPNLDLDSTLTAAQVADLDGETPQQLPAAATGAGTAAVHDRDQQKRTLVTPCMH